MEKVSTLESEERTWGYLLTRPGPEFVCMDSSHTEASNKGDESGGFHGPGERD